MTVLYIRSCVTTVESCTLCHLELNSLCLNIKKNIFKRLCQLNSNSLDEVEHVVLSSKAKYMSVGR